MIASRVFRGFTMDYSSDVEYAEGNGVWFSRVKGRGPWGYRWSKWAAASEPDFSRFFPVTGRRILPTVRREGQTLESGVIGEHDALGAVSP